MNCRIDEILLKAAEMNASDLHISEGGSVIVRIAGTLTKPGSVLSDVFSLVSTYTAAWKGWMLPSGLFPTAFLHAVDWDCRKHCGNFQN